MSNFGPKQDLIRPSPLNSIFSNRDSSEILPNTINWSHIDGLFDVILTIGKQSLIETDENVRS